MQATIPAVKPARPYFSCGPASKRPGWSFENLQNAALGRSHRSAVNRAKLKLAIDLTREVLEVPADYRIGIIPGSDTGAVEAALWSMLGQRGVDVIAWEAFSEHWVIDVVEQLRLPNVRATVADYGEIVDLSSLNFDNDVIFAWNGTTSGVCVQNGDFIPADRKGLTICDATSAAFGQKLDWDKLDVVTYSWQKVLGGEAGQGMLILSPRAVERLETYTPAWPIPKLFRLAEKGRLIEAIFEGETINTPSMMCVEDYLDALSWAKSIGGLDALMARVEANDRVMSDWVERTPWVAFLAKDPAIRSTTAACLKIIDPAVTSGGKQAEAAFAAEIVNFLEAEGLAFDVNSYRDAPPGLRIWCGATVDAADLEALTHWLDYAYERAKAMLFAEAA
ncbi:phosphoserine aminotransferase [Methylocella silvestris BL2]|uniref:phosphoserine transaminase n=1 Tax=Methylocella silvestris (strain DSM 15510 / CIP 108128 / LMG 27833 / NCIMB 13906 / BL2) TaxID=395965 RepID=B8ESL1_METSB|nr:phosphoserine transaminase [Methylocella silvestris]ACK50346.1 phosphoserine aminotransferase [Methylocella silvestris BL2]